MGPGQGQGTRTGSEDQLWGDPRAKMVTEDSREARDKGADGARIPDHQSQMQTL